VRASEKGRFVLFDLGIINKIGIVNLLSIKFTIFVTLIINLWIVQDVKA